MKIPAFILTLLSSLLLSFCRGIFYFPDSRTFFTPEKAGFKKEEIFFPAYNGVKLHAWYIPSRKGKAKGTIIQFHGNAENMSTHFINLLWMSDAGYDLYTFDYRGYGKSEGKPNRKLIYKDSILITNYVNELSKKNKLKLIIYGQSLGSIIALRVIPEIKDKENIAAVVAEGAFASYRDIARSKIRNVCFPPMDSILAFIFFPDSYSAKKSVPEVAPALLIAMHGRRDPVIPIQFGKDIYIMANKPKVFIETSNGGHMNWNHPRMQEHKKTFTDLLDKAISGKVSDQTEDVLTFE